MNRQPKLASWRDDSGYGSAAVYYLAHGYDLGVPPQNISVKITERWGETHADDRLLDCSISVKDAEGKRLAVEYSSGILSGWVHGSADDEENCRTILQIEETSQNG